MFAMACIDKMHMNTMGVDPPSAEASLLIVIDLADLVVAHGDEGDGTAVVLLDVLQEARVAEDKA